MGYIELMQKLYYNNKLVMSGSNINCLYGIYSINDLLIVSYTEYGPKIFI